MNKGLFTLLFIALFAFGVFGQDKIEIYQNSQQKIIAPGQLLENYPIERKQISNMKLILTENIFFEDFETSTDNWVRTDEPWEIGHPTTGPTSGYLSSNCVGTNLDGVYLPNRTSWLQTKTINLPVLPSSDESIVLRFNEWYETESSYDFAYVYVRENSGSWIQLSKKSGASEWVETEIDLTTYAGSNVEILFYFTTNSTNEFNGWFIDNVKVQHLGVDPLRTSLVTLDHTNFPYIYLNVNVDTFGTGIGFLTKDNFSVFENDVLQTGFFEVTPPETSGGTRLADIVFVLDVSGSMGDEIDAVKENMESFVNSLEESGVDYRVGFVTYADIVYVYNDAELYEGKETILSIIDSIELGEHGIGSGGDFPENQLEAMADASLMNFRAGSQRIEIMMTDATAHENDDVTSWTVVGLIEHLQAANITCYPVFDTGDQNQKDQYIPIANATNPDGEYYHIYDNFNEIINDISSSISNTYIVQYKSSDPNLNGILRNVEVKVSYNSEISSDFGSYTPGSAPKISRTNETKALHDHSWAEGTIFKIQANISDDYEPFMQSATLFYRSTNADLFESVEMVLISGDLYSAEIPGSAVVSPGTDYYISATDGQSKVTDPSTDPRQNPFQIAVLPNYAPQIIHSPVTHFVPGADISIIADVTDETNSLSDVTLFFRKLGQLIFTEVSMNNSSGDTFQENIPGSEVTYGGLEYYIRATDDFGISSYHGTADVPHLVSGDEYEPNIYSIIDVPHDQGGKVLISWKASTLDNKEVGDPVIFYSIWRAVYFSNKSFIDPQILDIQINKDFSGEVLRKKSTETNVLYWEWLANKPAHLLPEYSYAAETLYDSMSTTDGWHHFFISSHTSTGFSDSAPDSGYSVDNLAPATPLGLISFYMSDTKSINLVWDGNSESDLKHYNIYRRADETAEWSLIGSSAEPEFSDNPPNIETTIYFYTVNAEDIHENRSDLSESTSVVTSVGENETGVPVLFNLGQNFPNPFNPVTSISFAVPQNTHIKIDVFNALGEHITTLVDKKYNVGYYSVNWNAANLPSGVYFYKMSSPSYNQINKMLLLK